MCSKEKMRQSYNPRRVLSQYLDVRYDLKGRGCRVGQWVGEERKLQGVQSQGCKLMKQFHEQRKNEKIGSDSAMGYSCSRGRANRIHPI